MSKDLVNKDLLASKIQIRFRRKQFICSFLELKKVFQDLFKLSSPIVETRLFESKEDKNMVVNNNFDKLRKEMCNKKVIEMISIFLKRYYRLVNTTSIAPRLTPKDFLSSYMIVGFPEFVLDSKKDELVKESNYKSDIYLSSKDMLRYIDILFLYNKKPPKDILRRFTKSVNMYSHAFHIFLNYDKIAKIEELIQKWYHSDKTIDEIKEHKKYSEVQRAETLKVLKKTQDDTIKHILFLQPKFDLKQLTFYKNFTDKFEEVMKKSYWNVLEEDIAIGKYVVLMKILAEIKAELLNLRPNNVKYKEELDESLDFELMEQMIKNKAFDFKSLIRYAEYIIHKLIELQAPIRNDDTRKKWVEMLARMQNGDVGGFDKCATFIIKYIMELIQEIKDAIINSHIMSNLGINPLYLK
ncbi:MAG: hypothetical protein Edafosvirus12_20 [Edafosvirus sp.]|uniref:Uncharacterized protein n=1 Tax=Edafosvirus sp. TaxID=2487765 RepID=A0A3G4ZWQ3_9VIRU|nr:MAG: hypothetical protein Edafosvirus12_20 [Edafosvirus sp.]